MMKTVVMAIMVVTAGSQHRTIILPPVRSARAQRNLIIKEELTDTHNSRIKKPWTISSNDMKRNHITSASALCQFFSYSRDRP